MNVRREREIVAGPAGYSGLLDVLIRAGLIFALAVLCFQIFSPFLTLMVWALILAVTLYPLQQFLAAKIGGKQGLSATLIVILGIVLIIAPTAILMSSLGDSVHQLVNDVQNDVARDSGSARFRRGVARGWREGACAMVASARRSSGPHSEHAAEDRRSGKVRS